MIQLAMDNEDEDNGDEDNVIVCTPCLAVTAAFFATLAVMLYCLSGIARLRKLIKANADLSKSV